MSYKKTMKLFKNGSVFFGLGILFLGFLFALNVVFPPGAVAGDVTEAVVAGINDEFNDPHKMNVSIKNIESEKTTTWWHGYTGYNVSADAFNTGSAGFLTVSCTAFKKDGGAPVTQKPLSFSIGRNSERAFTCEFTADNLPKGDYIFNVTVAKEEVYS